MTSGNANLSCNDGSALAERLRRCASAEAALLAWDRSVSIPSLAALYARRVLPAPSATLRDSWSGQDLAVSSSPRPWIDVFALPEKFNMAVTERDLDLKVRKMSITYFLMTVRHLILKNYFWPDFSRGSLTYDRSKKCPTILYAVNLWLKPVSTTAQMPLKLKVKLQLTPVQKRVQLSLDAMLAHVAQWIICPV